MIRDAVGTFGGASDAGDMGDLRWYRIPAVAFRLHNRHIVAESVGVTNMPSKPNYNHQRAERDRAKKAAKEMKLQERKEQAALRKSSEAGRAEPNDGSAQGSEE